MTLTTNIAKNFIAFALTLTGYWAISHLWQRTATFELLLTFGGLFVIYIWVTNTTLSVPTQYFWLVAALLFRILFLFNYPSLSDDYVRFIWDGRLLLNHQNPYLYRPDELLHVARASQYGLNETLYQSLNSPHYYSVYPPFNQAIFRLAAWAGQGADLQTIIALKCCILIPEIISICLLSHWLNIQKTLIYALNPLVIIELTGNVHFEAFTVLFLIVFIRFLLQQQYFKSSLALTLAISVKFLPLILLPILVKKSGWRRGVLYSFLIVILNVFLFLPFVDIPHLQHIKSSLGLYFQRFEFNASLYYLVRQIGFWFVNYNLIQIIGPTLAVLSFLGIIWISFLSKLTLPTKILLIFVWYFMCANVVHPWYVVPLVALSVFTTNRFAIVWSALVFLSYAAYGQNPVFESPYILWVEYGIMALAAFYELKILKSPHQPSLP
jgi:alpha-1,6-mannosyltransferase